MILKTNLNKSLLVNDCFELSNSLLQSFIDKTARVPRGWQRHQVSRAIVIPHPIQMMNSIALRQRCTSLFPIQDMFSHIICWSLPWFIFRVCYPVRVWLRMINMDVTVLINLAPTLPRRAIRTITVLAQEAYLTIARLIFPTYGLAAIGTMLTRFLRSVHVVASASLQCQFPRAVRAVLQPTFRPTSIDLHTTQLAIRYHTAIITHNGHFDHERRCV